MAVATVTLASTAITASAGIAKWNEKSIEMGAITNSYNLANNTIHHSDLLNGVDKNFLVFSGVDKRLMEGKYPLIVSYNAPDAYINGMIKKNGGKT